tara:strand:- start:464 stop:583 length:120 start_codon:yes stop_codon:yes gene_type:complete
MGTLVTLFGGTLGVLPQRNITKDLDYLTLIFFMGVLWGF